MKVALLKIYRVRGKTVPYHIQDKRPSKDQWKVTCRSIDGKTDWTINHAMLPRSTSSRPEKLLKQVTTNLVTMIRSVQTWTPALLLDDVWVFYMKFNWTPQYGFVTETNWNTEMQRIHPHHRCHGESCFTHLYSLLRQNFVILKDANAFETTMYKNPKPAEKTAG